MDKKKMAMYECLKNDIATNNKVRSYIENIELRELCRNLVFMDKVVSEESPYIIGICKGKIFDEIVPNLKGKRQIYYDTGIIAQEESMYGSEWIFPVRLIKMRPRDILEQLLAENINMGILGSDVFDECQKSNEFEKLRGYRQGFGFCFAGKPDNLELWQKFLNGKERVKIATSYPNILSKIIQEKFADTISYDIMDISGCVESALFLNNDKKADFIFDIVETGKTLEECDLVTYRFEKNGYSYKEEPSVKDRKALVKEIEYMSIAKKTINR